MHPGPFEEIDGVRFLHAGSKLGVHREAWRLLHHGRLGTPEVIVDVQNGIPFFSPLATRGIPIVVLVHHLHREQWPIVYGPVRSRIGWLLESRVAPKLYRKYAYIAVSHGTKAELAGVGVTRERVSVIHSGTDELPREYRAGPATADLREPAPRILVLGRLVPHKQTEHVLWAAAQLRRDAPGLRVSVVGDGWWAGELRGAATRLGVTDIVDFAGYACEADKHRELSRAWVLALPSLKEGWGIAVMEAAQHGVPAVGYRGAGGVAESIKHLHTGLLADRGREEFLANLRLLLSNHDLRMRLGEAARIHASGFSWEETTTKFERVLHAATGTVVLPQSRESKLTIAATEPLRRRSG